MCMRLWCRVPSQLGACDFASEVVNGCQQAPGVFGRGARHATGLGWRNAPPKPALLAAVRCVWSEWWAGAARSNVCAHRGLTAF